MSASFIFVIRVLSPLPALVLYYYYGFLFFSFYFFKNSDLILLTCQLQVKKKSEIYINTFSGRRKQDSVKGKEKRKNHNPVLFLGNNLSLLCQNCTSRILKQG